MGISPTLLRLAFYAASDGPRVMIFGPSAADFGRLQQQFAWLAQSPKCECELHEQPFVRSFGGVRITARNVGPMFTGASAMRPGIRRVEGAEAPCFEWCRTSEGWDYLAKLMDGLTRVDAGHQYLTNYPSEDAIVVVSKGEYDDDVLM